MILLTKTPEKALDSISSIWQCWKSMEWAEEKTSIDRVGIDEICPITSSSHVFTNPESMKPRTTDA